MRAAFKKGDRVAWHHGYATQFAPETVVLASAVPVFDRKHPFHGDPGTGQFGTIVAAGNDEGTWWEVQLDAEKKSRVLTTDELVQIREDES